MIRNARYAKIHVILVALFAASTTTHGMHFIKRARVANPSHHVPTKKVARHAHKPPCWMNDTFSTIELSSSAYKNCKQSLLRKNLSSTIFSMELKACCSSVRMAHSLITDLVDRGEYEKVATVLKIPLFNDAELNGFIKLADIHLTKKHDIKYVHTIALLTEYKHHLTESSINGSSPTYDGGDSKIISNGKPTKTHGENSNCCCDWE
jgi:hypothetical protein